MLALRLGMTVRRLLAEISSAELTEWMAYFALEQSAAQAPAPATDVQQIKANFKRAAARSRGK